jgi:hypothetical protein|tara:strand:- start:5527 stop:5931 length:405 start_codon:yes stop_codon:yes gene_type:complete
MKNFKRAAVLSILAIVFTFGVTSCGKSKLNRKIDGTWNLTNVTMNGVDIYAANGMSITGKWTFDKKAKTLNATTTFTYPGQPAETSSDVLVYTISDKETIILDGEIFKVTTLTKSKLVLSYSDGLESLNYNFTN